MVVVKKREKEGFEVLLRRFNREVQQDGVLSEVKKRRFFEKKISRRKIRESARRKAIRFAKKYDY